ncbi:MAG: helix-turn-helix transcriptional regulator [Solirubrobacterales bacterium]|nr:helix-turn-helix transcriptional regulator [Solirubrobacterales bacterium]
MEPIGNTVRSSGEIGTVLRKRRRQLGMTQQTVADSIGVARRVIGELERGKPTVQLQIAVDVSNVLGLDLTLSARS